MKKGDVGFIFCFFTLLILSMSFILAKDQTSSVYLTEEEISFDQVDFIFPEFSITNSQWGRLTVNPKILYENKKNSEGYINVYTDSGWIVQNLYINPGKDSMPVSTYFKISNSIKKIESLNAYVRFNKEPSREFSDGEKNKYAVEKIIWNAVGVPSTIKTPEKILIPPMDGNQISKLDLGSPPGLPTWSFTLPYPANQEAAVNQCVPMSVANSLQFLEDYSKIRIISKHKPGLRGDNTLVGQLDTYMDRWAISRLQGDGLWFQPMLQGKFLYLKESGIRANWVHKHQGRGYGNASLGEALPDGNFSAYGSVSIDNGEKVTWEWICDEIKNGTDVEMIIQFSLGGGHAVRVFECGMTEEVPWLGYLHDRNQRNDTDGLETVRQPVFDMDSDGTINLGSPSIEIVFALSESATPYPPFLKKIRDFIWRIRDFLLPKKLFNPKKIIDVPDGDSFSN